MIRTLLLAAASAVALTACQPAHEDGFDTMTPMIGVLEDRAPATTEEAQRFVVRAVFEHDGETWRANEASEPTLLPMEMPWTVSLNGETLGEVRTVRPEAWTLLRDRGTLELAEGAVAPTQGERSTEFSGWDGAPVYRPLVATSTANFATPDVWARADLTPEARAAALATFKDTFVAVENCANATENVARPATYTEADITLSDSLTSQSGWTLVTAALSGYACDGPIYDTAYEPHMMLISSSNEVRVIGSSVQFLDAGDFNGDGSSEVLFVLGGYNSGGYILYFNDFRQSAEFVFNYH